MSRDYSNWKTLMWLRMDARRGSVLVPLLVPIVCQRGEVVHAAHSDHVMDWAQERSRRKTWDTVCGVRAYPLLVETLDYDKLIVWPPYVAGLRDMGWSRCLECHRGTGELRPRSKMMAGVAA